MADLKVGDTIWRFDINRRVYRERNVGPIYREHWVPEEITGQTSRSWLLGRWGARKVPKKGDHHGYAFTPKEVDDDCYLKENRYLIAQRVQYLDDVEQLRKIAEIVGYKTPEAK